MTTSNDAIPSTIPARAYTSPPAWLRFLIPAGLGLAADLALKAWSFPNFPENQGGRHPAEFYREPTPVVDHLLGFTTTVNHGAVFGIGQGLVLWFLLFSLIAMAIILWAFLTSRKNQFLVHITLGMITAGALGNLYDRALYHGVRDMLRFYVAWYPYIFNIADVLLCIAVPLLMLRWLFIKEPPQ
jgi:signal peptidase II